MAFPRKPTVKVIDNYAFYQMGSFCEIHPKQKLWRCETANKWSKSMVYTCNECKRLWTERNDIRTYV